VPLNTYYKHLRNKIKISYNKKLIYDSVLFTLMHATSNTRYSLINDASFPGHRIPLKEKESLLRDKMIKELSNNPGNFILTTLGIYTAEKNSEILNEQELISIIDKEYFLKLEIPKEKIKDDERITLFILIAIRAFSKECWMNLKTDDSLIIENLTKIFQKAGDMFYNQKLIKEEFSVSSDRERNAIFGITARCNDLKKYTASIYSFDGDRHYWLNLGHLTKTDLFGWKQALGPLFKLIVKNREIDLLLLNEMKEVCNEIGNQYIPIITNSTFYLELEYDEIINQSIDYLLEI